MQDDITNKLISWGADQPDIRAMLLTSTRAIPDAHTDIYSDYDIVLVSTDCTTRFNDRRWLSEFGDVVIDYWDPLTTADTLSGTPTSSGIVYYPGTLKIDFTLWSVEEVSAICAGPPLPAELDAGYQVLLDKDSRSWPAPTGHGYGIELPSEAEYLTLVNDFFIGVPYVMTALIREELLPAKWALNYDMRYVYLLPMLQWYALTMNTSADGNAADRPRFGINGKGLRQYLPDSVWQHFAETYSDLDVEVNRRALYRMIALFRDAAIVVGNAIGTAYPQELHDRVMAHVAALEATA